MIRKQLDHSPFTTGGLQLHIEPDAATRQLDHVGKFRQLETGRARQLMRGIAGHRGDQGAADGIVMVDDKSAIASDMDVEFEAVGASVDGGTEGIDGVSAQSERAAAVGKDQSVQRQVNLSVTSL